jgi:hypothetical protein
MALRNEEEPPMAELVSGKTSAVQAVEASPEDAFIREMIEELSWPRDQIRANLVGYEVVVRCSPADVGSVANQVEVISLRHDLYIATHQDLELGGVGVPCKRVLYINRIVCPSYPRTLKEAWMVFKINHKAHVVRMRLGESMLSIEAKLSRSEVVDALNREFVVKHMATFDEFTKLGNKMDRTDSLIFTITLRHSSSGDSASHKSGCCLC